MTQPLKVFVVIDLGCHECDVGSDPVGIYPTREQAERAAEKRDAKTKRWRDGGQTFAEVFEMDLPADA